MMRLLIFAAAALCACAPVTVRPVNRESFEEREVPRAITLVNANDTANTAAVIGELARRFAEAGFTVMDEDAVESRLEARGYSLDGLLLSGDYGVIGRVTGADAVATVRQFYGTEVYMVGTASGEVLASGCWQAAPLEVVNGVVAQLEGRRPLQRFCPVPLR